MLSLNIFCLSLINFSSLRIQISLNFFYYPVKIGVILMTSISVIFPICVYLFNVMSYLSRAESISRGHAFAKPLTI